MIGLVQHAGKLEFSEFLVIASQCAHWLAISRKEVQFLVDEFREMAG